MTITHPPALWTREEWQEVRRQVMEALEAAKQCIEAREDAQAPGQEGEG